MSGFVPGRKEKILALHAPTCLQYALDGSSAGWPPSRQRPLSTAGAVSGLSAHRGGPTPKDAVNLALGRRPLRLARKVERGETQCDPAATPSPHRRLL